MKRFLMIMMTVLLAVSITPVAQAEFASAEAYENPPTAEGGIIVTMTPNPFSEKFNIEVKNYEGFLTIMVYDVAGRRIMTEDGSIAIANVDNVFTIYTNNYPPGVYNIVVITSGGIFNGKCLKLS